MESVALDSFGGPEVLTVRTIPTPLLRPDQVSVEVEFATVNPTDVLLRTGAQVKALESAEGPWIPGMEFAGVIDQVGDACLDSGLGVGDLVIGLVNPRRLEGGAYTTSIRVDPSALAVRPASMAAAAAATLPMNGVTALMALEAVGLGAGGSVLITGGAGALGGYCIQLARKAGLTVIAHGRPGDVETLRDLGSTHVISGEDPLPASVHAILPQGVDAVIDTARIGLPAAAAVRDDGVMVHVLPPSGDRDARLQQEVVSVTKRMGDKAALERLVELTKDGVLTPRVATVLSMTRAPQAHELVERGGLRGRVVLDFRPGSNLAD